MNRNFIDDGYDIIEAGEDIVESAGIIDLLGKLLRTVDNALDKVGKIVDRRKTQDSKGEYLRFKTNNGNFIAIELKPIDGDDEHVDIRMCPYDGKKPNKEKMFEKRNMRVKELDDRVPELIEKWFGADDFHEEGDNDEKYTWDDAPADVQDAFSAKQLKTQHVVTSSRHFIAYPSNHKK